jgi:hypothetical protein
MAGQEGKGPGGLVKPALLSGVTYCVAIETAPARYKGPNGSLARLASPYAH